MTPSTTNGPPPATTSATTNSNNNNDTTAITALPPPPPAEQTTKQPPKKPHKHKPPRILTTLLHFAKLGPPLPQRRSRRAASDDAERALATNARMSVDAYRASRSSPSPSSSRSESHGSGRSSRYSRESSDEMGWAGDFELVGGGGGGRGESALDGERQWGRMGADDGAWRKELGLGIEGAGDGEMDEDVSPGGLHARVKRRSGQMDLHRQSVEQEHGHEEEERRGRLRARVQRSPADKEVEGGLHARIEHDHPLFTHWRRESNGTDGEESPPRIDSAIPRHSSASEQEEEEMNPEWTIGPDRQDVPQGMESSVSKGDEGHFGKLRKKTTWKGRGKLAEKFKPSKGAKKETA